MRGWKPVIRAALLATSALVASIGLMRDADAELRIDITRAQREPLPIAVSPFVGEGGLALQLPGVIERNLSNSCLFRTLPREAMIQTPEAMRSAAPNFQAWRGVGAQGLVTGAVIPQGGGRVRVEFRLWDVVAGQQIEGQVYTTGDANWRRIGHIISDAIYKRVTGEEAWFDSRIAFVAESGPRGRRIKQVATMDQDGEGITVLTDGRDLVLTPRFSPNGREIAFMSYANNQPRVYLLDIGSGRRSVVGDFPGMTFSPRFHPDGNRLIFSVSDNGLSDIWTYDLRSRGRQRLTNGPGINTAPAYAPNGSDFAFESDRGGTQQVYRSNGGRISAGGGRYATPVWSPRGDWIAFTKQEGDFSIGVMRPDGSGERAIARGFVVESPSWAPNGRTLVFSRQSPGGDSEVVTIDVTGFCERVVRRAASDPAWSPLNQ